jgi:uncharacterized membrane protein
MSPRTHVPTRLLSPLFLIAMAIGAVSIAMGSVPYFVGGDVHPFVLEKIEGGRLPNETTWTTALHVHVVAALFALPACLALALGSLRRRLPRMHRWLGRVTALVVLSALVPSGCYLALWAKGAASTAGFLLSAGITAIAMAQGVHAARARDFAAHRRCMGHVLAQLSVAVASRALLVLFDRAGVDPESAYVVALWAPVIGSALVAELVT